jgi:23S rRNA pseudouridine1911/1915/1917 synthase
MPKTNRKIDIIAETTDFIVVNKPAPLQAHPSKPNDTYTLWHALKEILAFELNNNGQISLINRLDRETSGITFIAKNAAAARQFGMAMEQGLFEKKYQAIVYGHPCWQEITLAEPILRKGSIMASPIYVRQMTHPQGAKASTAFKVISRGYFKNQPVSLIEAAPITGRMHQIRVHLEHLGHPIIGDKIYGQPDSSYLHFIDHGFDNFLKEQLLVDRQLLHASQLRIHLAKEPLSFFCPPPDDWLTLLESINPI